MLDANDFAACNEYTVNEEIERFPGWFLELDHGI
jgi:hypothetical protein